MKAFSAKASRALFVFLMSAALLHAYSDPPLDDLAAANAGIALGPGFEGYYNNATALDTLVTVSFGNLHPYSKDLIVSLSVDLPGLTDVVDGAACPQDGMALAASRGTASDPLEALPADGQPDFNCDAEHHSPAPRCDFDADQCAEFETNISVDYSRVNVTFMFGNASASVPFSSTEIAVPQEVVSAMRDSSGLDNLTALVAGDAVVSYWVDDQVYSAGDCVSNPIAFNATIPLSASRSFKVSGRNHLFFLNAPVLREQWFRNNRFDIVVLSQAPLYRARIVLNGNISSNLSFRKFDIQTAEDHYGISSILSTSCDICNGTRPGWMGPRCNGSFTPTGLESSNLSFAYVYEFNTTYEALGTTNLSVIVDDVCGGSGRFDDAVMSRMLSSNSVMENGSAFDPQVARPSTGFREEELGRASLGIGLIGAVLLLSFMNSWLR